MTKRKSATPASDIRALRVGDLMTHQIVALGPELPLRDAVAILEERHISGAPVVAWCQLLGVFSMSDLLAFQVNTSGVPADRPANEDRWEFEPSEEWEEGDEAPGAFVADWWADAGAEVVERFREIQQAEWDVLAEHTVSEAMSRKVCSIAPDNSVTDAARYMRRAGVHRLLVVENGNTVGILTTMDIVGAVADGRLRQA